MIHLNTSSSSNLPEPQTVFGYSFPEPAIPYKMTIVDSNADQELIRLWGVIAELSEQLSQNRALSVSLYTQAGTIKNQAIHSQTGFVLRRFNLDKSQEEYDTELEHMNSAIISENQGLQYDNKQLNVLIKDYEQTLESLMSAFRNRAREVQEKELSLIREYESKLLLAEEEAATQELAASTAVSQSLARLSRTFRQYTRALNGEDPDSLDFTEDGSTTPRLAPHIEAGLSPAEWALEREIELVRLEEENAMLHRMLGEPVEEGSVMDKPELARALSGMPLQHGKGPLGGYPGRVGPFGTYKRAMGSD